MKYTNLQSSFHSYVLLSARLLLLFVPSCPAICYLHQTIFFHLLIRNILYTQSHMNSNIQELVLVVYLLCASIGVDCRVESSISPGARLHDMIIIANQVQSTEIFGHPPILISSSMSLLLCGLSIS